MNAVARIAHLTPDVASVPAGLAEASLADSRAELQRIFEDATTELAPLRHAAAEAEEQLAQLQADHVSPSSEELEEAIPLLLETEQAAKARHERNVAIILRLEASVGARMPDLLPDVKKITRLIDDLEVSWLIALRDLRWEAMAILAGRHPPQRGEVISSQEQHRAWFDELDRLEE